MTRKKRNTENMKRAGRKPLVLDADLFLTVKDYKVLDDKNQIYPLSNSVWKEIVKNPIINNKLTESTVHKRVFDDWKDQEKSKLKEILSGGYVHRKATISTPEDINIVSQKVNDDPKIDTIKELHKLKKDAVFSMAIKGVNIHKFNVSNFSPEELYAWKCSCKLDLTFVITSGKYCFQNVDIEIDGNKNYTFKSITEHSIFSIFENHAVPLGTLLQDKLDCSADINNFFLEMFRHMTTIYFPQVIFISSNLELKEGLSLALYNKTCTQYSDMCLEFLSAENDLISLIKTVIRYDVSLIFEYFPGKNYFKTDDHRRFYVKTVLLLSQCCTLESFKHLLFEIFVTAGTECITNENIDSIESLRMKVNNLDSTLYVLENDESVREKPPQVSIKLDSVTFIFIDEILKEAKKKWIKALSHDTALNANYLNNRVIDILKTICLEFLFWSGIVNQTSLHKEPATNFYSKFNNFTNFNQNQTYEVCDFLKKMIGFKQEVLAEIRILFPSKIKREVKKTRKESNDRYIRQENWGGLIEEATTRQFDEFDDPKEKDEIEIADPENEKSIEENSPCGDEISINCNEDSQSIQTEVEATSTNGEYKLIYPVTVEDVYNSSIISHIPISNGEKEKTTDSFDEAYIKSHSSFVDDECTETLQIPGFDARKTDSFQDICVERVETLSSSDSDDENEKPAHTLPNLDVDPGEESETERVWVGGSTDSLPQLYSSCFRWDWRQLIRNGLSLPSITYEGKLYKLINTCPLDSIVEVMVACACFRNSFGNLVTKLHVAGLQSEIFALIYEYEDKFSRQLYYQMRLKFCLDSGRYTLKHNNGYIQIDCGDSIDALYDYLFRKDHSITKRIKCDKCSHDNTRTFTTEHLDPYHVDIDPSLSTMKEFLEKKYSKSKKKCYEDNCNGKCTVSYKITEWFCVNVEPAYMLNENAYATLSKIPSSINVQREFILTGIVAFDPPSKEKMKNQIDKKDDYREKGLAHYYAYNRFTDGEWEKRDGLLEVIYRYSKNTREKLKPALLLYVQRNVTSSLL